MDAEDWTMKADDWVGQWICGFRERTISWLLDEATAEEALEFGMLLRRDSAVHLELILMRMVLELSKRRGVMGDPAKTPS